MIQVQLSQHPTPGKEALSGDCSSSWYFSKLIDSLPLGKEYGIPTVTHVVEKKFVLIGIYHTAAKTLFLYQGISYRYENTISLLRHFILQRKHYSFSKTYITVYCNGNTIPLPKHKLQSKNYSVAKTYCNQNTFLG